MRKLLMLLIVLAAVCWSAVPLSAQLAVNIRISQLNYLAFEPVFVRVSVRNFSAHAVAFGNRRELSGSLRFEITPDTDVRRKVPLLKPDGLPPVTGSIIAPGATQEYTFNLCDYYDLRTVGKYSVRAVIRHNLFHDEYISPSVYVNIVKGMTLWSQVVGVPALDGEKEKPGKKVEQRKYSIITYPTGRSQVYNLKVEDDRNVYANRRLAFDLGSELRPECEIDFLSRLNVVVAASSRVFAYYVFDPNGRLEKRKVLIRTNARPSLSVDPKTGYVSVLGGREAERDKDYEEIRDLPFVGMRADSGGPVPPPPKTDAIKRFDAIRE